MNAAAVSWIDVISPVVTFILVIVLPPILAGWVIFRTVTGKDDASDDITPAGPPTGADEHQSAREVADA